MVGKMTEMFFTQFLLGMIVQAGDKQPAFPRCDFCQINIKRETFAVLAFANLLKIPQGGWFPLVVAGGIFTLMATWKRGRVVVWERIRSTSMPLEKFITEIARRDPVRVAVVPAREAPEAVEEAIWHRVAPLLRNAGFAVE